MNYYSLLRGLKFLIVCAGLALSGCTTSALLKEAKGQVKSELKYGVIKIDSAYKEVDSNLVHVCMDVMDMDNYTEREVTLDIPLRNSKRWSINPLSTGYSAVDSSKRPTNLMGEYVGFRPMPEDLSPTCLSHGKQIPVFNVNTVISPYDSEQNQEKLSFSLPMGETEAIYAINSKGFTTNFGYVSAQPVIEHSYAIDVSADDLMDVRSMKNQKPYLYLLTPVTVAIDVTAAAIGVAFEAVLLRYTSFSSDQYPADYNGSITITSP